MNIADLARKWIGTQARLSGKHFLESSLQKKCHLFRKFYYNMNVLWQNVSMVINQIMTDKSPL